MAARASYGATHRTGDRDRERRMTTPPTRRIDLLRNRVCFVSGKGGTGKSTVAVAIARQAAAADPRRRVLLVELDAQRSAMPGLVGVQAGYVPVTAPGGFSVANLTWAESLDDWLKAIVGVPRLVRGILKNRVVSLFLEATPGARDLVVMTRVLQLARDWDTVIVDMPASGNAVAMVGIAHTAHRLFEAGPIRRCAEDLLALYARPDVCAALVALPEEMVVNETLETAAKLARECAPLRLGAVLLNRAAPPSVTAAERAAIEALAQRGDLPVEAQALVEAGRWDLALEDATALARTRLHEGLPEVGITVLPTLPRGESSARVAEALARALARAREAA
jgi:arsenite-transporting ATPase